MELIKLWMINATTLFLSLTDINLGLKFILLILSISFTIYQWWKLIKKDVDDFNKKL